MNATSSPPPTSSVSPAQAPPPSPAPTPTVPYISHFVVITLKLHMSPQQAPRFVNASELIRRQIAQILGFPSWRVTKFYILHTSTPTPTNTNTNTTATITTRQYILTDNPIYVVGLVTVNISRMQQIFALASGLSSITIASQNIQIYATKQLLAALAQFEALIVLGSAFVAGFIAVMIYLGWRHRKITRRLKERRRKVRVESRPSQDDRQSHGDAQDWTFEMHSIPADSLSRKIYTTSSPTFENELDPSIGQPPPCATHNNNVNNNNNHSQHHTNNDDINSDSDSDNNDNHGTNTNTNTNNNDHSEHRTRVVTRK